MESGRENAVLFVELLGAAELFARAGDAAAHEAIAQCAGRLEQAAGRDARMIKMLGSRLMLLAPNADAAARAALAMHAVASDFGADSLSLGVGFHFGPVIEQNDDVFGDTVNLAARLVEQAAKGQILLAAETAAALSSLYSRSMRRLYSMPLKGRSEEVSLCELVWRTDQAATVLPFTAAKPSHARLTLRYRETRLVLLDGAETLTIGREDDCGLVLPDATASRHHCTIHRRNDHFVLVDRSTNGTYVTVDGDREMLLQHDEVMLRKQGWISFGIPKGAGSEAAEFFCD